MKQKEVDERVELDDALVVAIVDKLIKQRKDSIEAFTKADRLDLTDKETAEMKVLQAYLPARLSADEVLTAQQYVARVGARTAPHKGSVVRLTANPDQVHVFSVNSVLGLGGVLDIASEMGVDRHKQDFGLTLGRWGVPTGPYLVLPLLGPSTVRDTAALPVDYMVGDLVDYVDHIPVRNSMYGLGFIDRRAQLLGAGTVLDEAALDPYSFTRDVYLKLRDNASDDADGGQLPEDY